MIYLCKCTLNYRNKRVFFKRDRSKNPPRNLSSRVHWSTVMLWESLHFKIKATCDYHNDFNKEIRFPISIRKVFSYFQYWLLTSGGVYTFCRMKESFVKSIRFDCLRSLKSCFEDHWNHPTNLYHSRSSLLSLLYTRVIQQNYYEHLKLK